MKVVLIVIIFLCGSSSYALTDSTQCFTQRDSIIDYAQEFLGTPYLWGGRSESGFDCSGFVYHVFRHFGISVPRTSSGYKGMGDDVALENASPGDVILFTGTNSSVRRIGHVGIVISNCDGQLDFIHSSSSKKHYGVTITRYNNSGYTKRFLSIINLLT